MIPIEVFAAKDEVGAYKGAMLAAPVGCGLKQADTLRIHGARLIALEARSMLPIDLPLLDETSRRALVEAAAREGTIAVGEFTALGLADSYMLALELVTAASGAEGNSGGL